MPAIGPVPVADQFYFIAHDDRTGARLLHPRAIGLGLAGALLGELVLVDCIDVYNGSVYVVRREPPADALNHATLTWLLSQPQHHDVRTWLAFLAETATDGVAKRLTVTRQVKPLYHKRLLGSRITYVPTDTNLAAWQSVRIGNL